MTTAMPVLDTERLRVRPLVLDDLETVHRISNAGFGEVTLAQRRDWLEWAVRNHSALANLYQPPYGDRAVVLKATDEVVGMAGLVPTNGPYRRLAMMRRSGEQEDRFHNPEFGLFWVTAPEHQRKGYAAEAAQAMIDYAFQILNIRRIVAETDTDNLASQAVMRRLGMTIEHNPTPGDLPWFQVVGVLYNPASGY